MKLTAQKEGTPRYFSAKLGWKEAFEPKEIELLSSNMLSMLIPPENVQGRKNNVIQYNITQYSTLEFYLTCILSKEQLIDVLKQCVHTFRELQKVYLNYNNLVLDFKQIYVLLSDGTLHFIYLPLSNSKRENSIPEFFCSLLRKANRSTYEQVTFIESCLAWLERPAPFVLDAFETFIADGGVDAEKPYKQYENSAVVVSPVQQSDAQQFCPVETQQKIYQDMNMDTRDHTVSFFEQSQYNDGTVILMDYGMEPVQKYYILRVSTQERVELNNFPFLVGSEAGKVSYYVKDNPAVSRRHAEFTKNGEGKVFITDQKSTNKTYVNNCVLEPYQAVELHDGDEVRLANEDFTFIVEG